VTHPSTEVDGMSDVSRPESSMTNVITFEKPTSDLINIKSTLTNFGFNPFLNKENGKILKILVA